MGEDRPTHSDAMVDSDVQRLAIRAISIRVTHQDGLLQVALLDAGHEEGLDDLAVQVGAQRRLQKSDSIPTRTRPPQPIGHISDHHPPTLPTSPTTNSTIVLPTAAG